MSPQSLGLGFQGFRVSGFQGFRVSGFRVSGFQGLGFRVSGFQGLGFRVYGLGFQGFRVSGFQGFRVSVFRLKRPGQPRQEAKKRYEELLHAPTLRPKPQTRNPKP